MIRPFQALLLAFLAGPVLAHADYVNQVFDDYGFIKIHPGEAEDFWRDRAHTGNVFVDVRSFAAFKEGHIPGAISVPGNPAQFNDGYKLNAAILHCAPKLIVYGNGSAWEAREAGTILAFQHSIFSLGPEGPKHPNFAIFTEGYAAWVQDNQPVETGDQSTPVCRQSVVSPAPTTEGTKAGSPPPAPVPPDVLPDSPAAQTPGTTYAPTAIPKLALTWDDRSIDPKKPADFRLVPAIFKVVGGGTDKNLAWRLKIFGPDGVLFKTYSGELNDSAERIWYGIGDNGKDFYSNFVYEFKLELIDRSGNPLKLSEDQKMRLVFLQ